MKKLNFPHFLLFALVLTFSFTVRAQENPMPTDAPNGDFQRPNQKRPNLLRELGLSREQMRTIRSLNAERKTLMQDAQLRLGDARRNLDIAIYADNVNESDVEARLKEFQTAQAEVARIRSTTEYEIRKILTPDQVVRFRELRQRFAEMREDFQNRPNNQRPNLRRDRQNKFVKGQSYKRPAKN